MPAGYIGRFAPSPTGPLHFGSLVAAVASYLDARAQGGKWLVRMEDIDPPRAMPGAADLILKQLETYGLHWDDSLCYQSLRLHRYQDILDQLFAKGIAYYCDCTRQILRAAGGIYTGRCWLRTGLGEDNTAVRVHIPANTLIQFNDIFQGRQQQNLPRETGDFIVRRRDQLFAYQLAVAVDDWDQRISHIVRGIDLLSSTPKQLWLLQLLATLEGGSRPSALAATPCYGHVPMAINSLGQKLSKQNRATALDLQQPAVTLRRALMWLGIDMADFDRGDSNPEAQPEQLLAYGVSRWQRHRLFGKTAIDAPNGYS